MFMFNVVNVESAARHFLGAFTNLAERPLTSLRLLTCPSVRMNQFENR